MRRRNFFFISLAFLAVSIVTIFASPWILRSYLEEKIADLVSGKAQIAELEILSFKSLNIRNLKIQSPELGLSFQLPLVNINLTATGRRKNTSVLEVLAENPVFTFDLDNSRPIPGLPTDMEEFIESHSYLNNLKIQVRLQNGIFRFLKDKKVLVHGEQSQAVLNISSLQYPYRLEFDTVLQFPQISEKDRVPFRFDTAVEWNQKQIDFRESEIAFWNIKSKLFASYSPASQKFYLHVHSKPHQFMHDKEFSLVKSYTGLVQFEVNTMGVWGQEGTVSGFLKLNDFKTKVHWKNDRDQVSGQLQGQWQTHFKISEMFKTPNLKIEKTNWDLDATQMHLAFLPYFQKPENIPLLLSGEGDGTQDIFIQKAKVDFQQIKLEAAADLSSLGLSRLNFAIPSFPVAGLEPYFPLFSSQAMKGIVEVRGELTYDPAQRDQYLLKLDHLRLQKFSGFINFENQLLRIHGPFHSGSAVQISAVLKPKNWTHSHLQSSGLLRFEFPDVLVKDFSAPHVTPIPHSLIKDIKLQTKINVQKLEWQDLQVQNVQLMIENESGQAGITGTIQNIFSGKVQVDRAMISLHQKDLPTEVSVRLEQINLAELLAPFYPHAKDQAQGQLSGEASMKTTFSNPSDFSGEAHLKLENALIKNLEVDQQVAKALSQLKEGLPSLEMTSAPLKFGGEFTFQRDQVQIKQLTVSNSRQEEFDFEGPIVLSDMGTQIDLKGQAFVTRAPVTRNFFNDHKDAYDRLPIPVTWSGSLSQPELNLDSDWLQKALKNLATEMMKPTTIGQRVPATKSQRPNVSMPEDGEDTDSVQDLFGR